jgi:hypothetical protein
MSFILQEPARPIGAEACDLLGAQTDHVQCPVRFIFDKTESVDVVIEKLQGLKAKMLADVKAHALG